MQRLLQGDVASGKTVVALYALLRAVEIGRQGALMAPTETLAEQHFLTIDELCAPLGVRVSLLTSSLRAREHAAVRQLIASGDAHVVVGTHALIQKEVDFHDLAVAVVDEQHRFGVGVALARGMLWNPRWGWHAAETLGVQIDAPAQSRLGNAKVLRPHVGAFTRTAT